MCTSFFLKSKFATLRNSVLRTLVPEKFPDFIIAQIILQIPTGFSLYVKTNFFGAKRIST